MLSDVKDENFEFIITCHVPICPHCGGALYNRSNHMIYKCNDCFSIFKVDRPGQAENEMVCKEIFLNPDEQPADKTEVTVNKVADSLYKNITGEESTK